MKTLNISGMVLIKHFVWYRTARGQLELVWIIPALEKTFNTDVFVTTANDVQVLFLTGIKFSYRFLLTRSMEIGEPNLRHLVVIQVYGKK